MIPPPNIVNYPEFISPNVKNPYTTCAVFAFSDIRLLWGTAAPQYYAELQTIIDAGVPA